MRALRPYQVQTVEAVLREWETKRSTLAALATGCGKTFTAAEICRQRLGHGRILWVAHRTELITQARDALAAHMPDVRIGIEKADVYANTHSLSEMHDQIVVASVQTLHEKRRLRFDPRLFGTIIVDECFPAGTMVGNKRIEDIRAGDTIRSYDEATGTITESVVAAQWSKKPSCMVRFVTSRGTVVCTANHPVLTRGGWMPAGMLTEYDEVAYDEAFDVRCVRSGNGNAGAAHLAPHQVCPVQADCAAGTIDAEGVGRLVCDLRSVADAYGEARYYRADLRASMLQRVLHEGSCQFRIVGPHGSHESQARIGADEAEQPDEAGRVAHEDVRNSQDDRPQTKDPRREWARADGSAGGVDVRARGRMGHGASGQYEDARAGVPALLQGGHRSPGADDRRGDRRGVTPSVDPSRAGRAEGSVPTWVRVDRVSFLEQGSDGTFGGVCPDGLVYNLEVEGTHTYTANGFVVHNCHHSTAKSYRSILDHFPNAKVLGLTATPDRSDGVGLAGIFDSIAHAYTMEDAIQAGYLTPIRIRAVMIDSIDLSHVKTTAGDLNNAQLAEVMERFEAIHGVAISVAENIGRRSAIVFCASVKQSKDLCEVLAGYLAPRRAQVRHIDGTTPEETRKRILAEYAAGEVQVICNCAVLTEGFDAPCTSMIVLARPTKSRALYTQMVGRGTRLFPGKEDCLIYDYKGNAGRHDLAGPLDLIGKDLPDDVRSILEKMQRDGKVLDDEAIEQAKRERAEQLAEQDRKRKEMAAIRAKARYTVTSIQAFNREFTPSQRASHDPVPMSDKQRSVIVGFGMEIKKALTRAEASELIDKLVKRRERGLCTYKQALKLGENGLRTDLTFAQAKEAMDAIVANRWSAPQWLRAKYGAPAMEATL